MAAMATMALLNARYPAPNHLNPSSRPTPLKPAVVSLPNLPKGLAAAATPKPMTAAAAPPPLSAAAIIAGAFFAGLSSSDAALAAQQIADIAADDNRGLALLIPLIPAILWVLYNILQPALNQLDRMRSEKAVVVGLGLGGGLAAAGFVAAPSASADELAVIADAAAATSSDSRGLLLLFVVAPAILWVLYNILQPALNQLEKMRSG